MHANELVLMLVGIGMIMLATGRAAAAEGSVVSTPLPAGVVELVGVAGMSNGLVELKDGSLLMNDGRISTDGGLTWGEGRSFGEGISGSGLLRLQSGALALTQSVGYGKGMMWVSADEAQTWEPCSPVKTPGGPDYAMADVMIQLNSGRLLYPWDCDYVGEHPEMMYKDMLAWGTWKGQRYDVEGHGHTPEYFATGISYSDDQGKTWHLDRRFGGGCPLVLMGWFDFEGNPNGMCGITPCGESSVAETNDGRVLMFGRSTVGRIVHSYSNDDGKSWSAVLPTELAASNSPPRLRRIPKTGDLLCVWNQVSGEEIRRGYRRGRLSAAISKDSGATWENFKTIEVSEGLEDGPRVYPDPESRMVRARQDVGELPDGWAYFHYCNVCFAGDKVYIMYARGSPLLGIAEQNLHKQESVVRIYPVEYFYQE